MATSTVRKSKTTKAKKLKKRLVKKGRAKLPKRKKASTKKATKKKAPKKVAKKRSAPKKLAARAASPSTQEVTTKLNVGDWAPTFTLNDQNGTQVSLNQFRGQNVVLYFYPKDDTPGCTKEACSFRDHLPNLQGMNAVILGVSFDDQDSHQKFIGKYGLNFTLLSDTEKKTANDYGVYVQKNMYGNISWGIERSTFIIDKDGRLARIFRRVQVDGHTEEVIEALRSLNA